MVYTLCPQCAGEDVVQLDVDGGEGQKARHAHLRQRAAVPRRRRDLARILGRATRRVEVALSVFPGDAPKHGDGAVTSRRWTPCSWCRRIEQGSASVRDGDCSERKHDEHPRDAEQETGEQHVAHPVLAPSVGSGSPRRYPAMPLVPGVNHDDRREQSAAVVARTNAPPHARVVEHAHGHREQLCAGPNHRAELRRRSPGNRNTSP